MASPELAASCALKLENELVDRMTMLLQEKLKW
jgi:hypothetical protein